MISSLFLNITIFFKYFTCFFAFLYLALTLIRDGVARIIIIVYNLDTLNHAILCNWVLPTTYYRRGSKRVLNPLLRGLWACFVHANL